MNVSDLIESAKSLEIIGLVGPLTLLGIDHIYDIFPISLSGRPRFELFSLLMIAFAYIFGVYYSWSFESTRFAPASPKRGLIWGPIMACLGCFGVLVAYVMLGRSLERWAPGNPWVFDYGPPILAFIGSFAVLLFSFCIISGLGILYRIRKRK